MSQPPLPLAQRRRDRAVSLPATTKKAENSSCAAIRLAPTLIGTVYVNPEQAPDLRSSSGYLSALSLMLVINVELYLISRRRG